MRATATGIDVDLERIGEICRRFCVARLDVFGSVARGVARPVSDVDVERIRPMALLFDSAIPLVIFPSMVASIDVRWNRIVRASFTNGASAASSRTVSSA